jgi:hypothetical protein
VPSRAGTRGRLFNSGISSQFNSIDQNIPGLSGDRPSGGRLGEQTFD